jgi:hypothetical protein
MIILVIWCKASVCVLVSRNECCKYRVKKVSNVGQYGTEVKVSIQKFLICLMALVKFLKGKATVNCRSLNIMLMNFVVASVLSSWKWRQAAWPTVFPHREVTIFGQHTRNVKVTDAV